MSDSHDHPHHHTDPIAPVIQEDATSQALSAALRSSFTIVRVIMVVLVIVFCFSGMKQIGPQEQAIKLRFGKPVGQGEKALLGPGFHWAWPYPIDEVVRIPIGKVQTIASSVGWYPTSPALRAAGQEPPPGLSLNPATDGYTLTSDGNIMHVEATLSYRITDPIRFVFSFASASNFVQNALNNAIVFASAHFAVDAALTREIIAFKERIRFRLEQLIQQQQLGITVDQVDVQAIPPRQLKANFDAVVKASAESGKRLNDARTYANETTNRAAGEAAVRLSVGQADRARLVTTVSEESRRFSRLLPHYQRNPEFFVRQQQVETLQRILTDPDVEKWVLNQGPGGVPHELRLLLNRELQRPRATAPKTAPADQH